MSRPGPHREVLFLPGTGDAAAAPLNPHAKGKALSGETESDGSRPTDDGEDLPGY